MAEIDDGGAPPSRGSGLRRQPPATLSVMPLGNRGDVLRKRLAGGGVQSTYGERGEYRPGWYRRSAS